MPIQLRSRPLKLACFALILCSATVAAVAEPPRSKQTAQADDSVDINRATVAELMRVPGMKQTWAERIVRFRPYRTKLDLLEKGVLPVEVYQRVKDSLIAHQGKP